MRISTGFGEKGPDASAGVYITAYGPAVAVWSRTRRRGDPLHLAGGRKRRTMPPASATIRDCFTALYRRERTSARVPMSRRRSCARASCRKRFRSRPRYGEGNSSDRTTERIRRMRVDVYRASTALGSFLSLRLTTARRRESTRPCRSPTDPSLLRSREVDAEHGGS